MTLLDRFHKLQRQSRITGGEMLERKDLFFLPNGTKLVIVDRQGSKIPYWYLARFCVLPGVYKLNSITETTAVNLIHEDKSLLIKLVDKYGKSDDCDWVAYVCS